jgi:hypothetical protein
MGCDMLPDARVDVQEAIVPGFASVHGSRPPSAGQHSAPVSPDVQVQQDNDFLTIQDAARRCGVSRAFVLSWIRNGFIEAQTSKQGWLVRAGDIEAARQNAEDSRMGYGAEYTDQDREDSGEDTLLEERQHIPVLATLRQSPDLMTSPVAEFMREQSDVIQEQAETIGWLQAELRRLRDSGDGEQASQDEALSASEPEAAQMTTESVDETPLGPLDIIAADPFSEEAEQARVMIEETEQKITDMWHEHAQRRSRHLDSRDDFKTRHNRQADDTWIRRIVGSWKK